MKAQWVMLKPHIYKSYGCWCVVRKYERKTKRLNVRRCYGHGLTINEAWKDIHGYL